MEELVRFDGGETEYFSFGSGERTFVILPGLGTRSILFSRMMISAAYKRFCDDFTVYVFTAAGTFRRLTQSARWLATLRRQ